MHSPIAEQGSLFIVAANDSIVRNGCADDGRNAMCPRVMESASEELPHAHIVSNDTLRRRTEKVCNQETT